MSAVFNAQTPSDHPALQAWRTVHGVRIPPAQVDSLKRTRKSHVYRIHGVGPDRAAVIAKRGRTLIVERERRVYEQVLDRLPGAAVPYLGAVTEPGGRFAWLFTQEASGDAYSPLLPEHRRVAAAWLAHLHVTAATTSPTGWLPDRGPAHYRRRLDALAVAFGAQLRHPDWNQDGQHVLHRVSGACSAIDQRWSRLEAICFGVSASVVHGDFKQKNLRVDSVCAPLGLMAFDWAHCGWGVPAVDLARTATSDRPLSANPDLDVYHAMAAEEQPSLTSSRVAALAVAGSVFRCLDSIAWELVWLSAARKSSAEGRSESWQDRPLTNLGVCSEELSFAASEL
jgi:aminoglycoside phosphotransferase (APT) family kinase protein